MPIRPRADNGSGNGRDDRESCESGPPIAAVAASSHVERVDYIAAMVQELRIMARQANLRTLANLLELAYREALQQRRQDR
jgi:hypothetical protein